MLVSHFDTYGNGIKTTWKPKPNSLGIPDILHTQKYVNQAFFRAPFGLSSEPRFKYKGTQYLQLEMRSTHAPRVIFVPHIIPNIWAFQSFAQRSVYKKIFPKHHRGTWRALGGAYEDLCVQIVRRFMRPTVPPFRDPSSVTPTLTRNKKFWHFFEIYSGDMAHII